MALKYKPLMMATSAATIARATLSASGI